MRGAVLALFFTGVAFLAEAAPEPRIAASLDNTRITIGERVTLTLQLDLPEGFSVVGSNLREGLGELVVKDTAQSPPEALSNGLTRHTIQARLTAYATGTFVLPPVSVTVRNAEGRTETLETLEHVIEVKSVAPEGDKLEDIREIKGILFLAGSGGSVLWLIGGVAFLVGLFWWLFRRGRAVRVSEAPKVSPDVTALEALDRLDASGLVHRDMKEYHFRVSGILRHYLEERFGLKAPEQTTEEFLASVSDHSLLRGDQRGLLSRFLEQCDLVKFAKLTPEKEEALRISQSAREFIRQTRSSGV